MVFCGILWRLRRQKRRPRRGWSVGNQTAGIETLEDRLVLTAIVMTVQEQLLLELINRARSNPSAEAARFGIGLNDGLDPGTIPPAPQQPLAPNQILTDVAGAHSQDMLDNDYFSHQGLDGRWPSDRASDAGYPVGAGENIAWGGSTGQIDQNQHVYERHEGLFKSAGHRENMLTSHYQEAGMGVRYGPFTNPDDGVTYNASMATEMFANPPGNPFLTGVVFTDASDGSADDDGFFTIGEQVSSGTITATQTGSGLSYTTTLGPSGGYSLQVPSGTYTVAAGGGALSTTYIVTGVVISTQNVKADFETTTASPVIASGTDTVGLYEPSSSMFFLNNSNSTKNADLAFGYGPGGLGWEPIVGDWDGDGTDTVGLYVPGSSTFFLNNSNSTKNADLVFGYGPGGLGWEPIVGDWDGNGTDTVGLYVPGSSLFFLNNSNATKNADIVFGYGPGGLGWEPIVGDWDGNATDTVGLYVPGSSMFFLNNSNSTKNADIVFGYGAGGLGWEPIVGDWDADDTDTVGLYVPGSSTFLLNNSNSTKNADLVFGYGPGGLSWEPIVGDWDGGSAIQLSSPAVLPEPVMEDLGAEDLQPVIETAIGLWADAGISEADLDRLGQVAVSVADLSGSSLAVTSSFGIQVDVDAAGHGWFVDTTPHQNEEFLLDTETGNLRAVGSVASQVDLLTVLVHEFGHVLGLRHDSVESVMNGLLPLGVRRLPSVDLIDAIFSSETR